MSSWYIAHFELYFRLGIAGTLGVGGLFMLIFANNFGQTRALFRRIDLDPKGRRWFVLPSDPRDPVEGQPVLTGHGPLVGAGAPTIRQRLFRAAEERDRVEQPIMRAYGRAFGVFALICTACTFLPSVPMTVPYAAFWAGFGCISLAAYMRSKAPSPKRIASLNVREMRSSLPVYQICAGVLAALTPLILLPDPDVRWTGLATCFGSLLLVYVSIGMTRTPSQLRGKDLAAERAVDAYVRQYRARLTMAAPSVVSILTLSIINLGRTPNSLTDVLLYFIASFVLLCTMCISIFAMATARLTSSEIEELETS